MRELAPAMLNERQRRKCIFAPAFFLQIIGMLFSKVLSAGTPPYIGYGQANTATVKSDCGLPVCRRLKTLGLNCVRSN